MNMILAEDIVSVTDFARGTKEHLEEMTKTHRPRVLTQNGKAAAVVVPVELYDQMAQDACERKWTCSSRRRRRHRRVGTKAWTAQQCSPESTWIKGIFRRAKFRDYSLHGVA